MIQKISHIGIAVNSIDDTVKLLADAFGAKELARQEIPQMGQTSALVQVADGKYEVMEPLGEKGTVQKFLAAHGEGFHHISLYSDDWETDIAALEAKGMILSKASAGKMSVAFTNPKTTGGVLYEITNTPM